METMVSEVSLVTTNLDDLRKKGNHFKHWTSQIQWKMNYRRK